MDNRTASFPGWYVEFQANVLRQLPRPGEIDQETAGGWNSNQKDLKGILADSLLLATEKDEKDDRFKLLSAFDIIVPANIRKSTNENFENVANKLIPGKTYLIKVFGIKSGKGVGSYDCLRFSQEQSALFAGVQKRSDMRQQKKKKPSMTSVLPDIFWYSLTVADWGGFDQEWSSLNSIKNRCLLCICEKE